MRHEVMGNTLVQNARRTQESKMLKVALEVGTTCLSLNQLQKKNKGRKQSAHSYALLGIAGRRVIVLESDKSTYVTVLGR